MTKLVKPRWLPAVLACVVSTVFVGPRPTDPNGGETAAQAPASADVVFRHYL